MAGQEKCEPNKAAEGERQETPDQEQNEASSEKCDEVKHECVYVLLIWYLPITAQDRTADSMAGM